MYGIKVTYKGKRTAIPRKFRKKSVAKKTIKEGLDVMKQAKKGSKKYHKHYVKISNPRIYKI